MEFEKLKEDLREILNTYLDNIDEVKLDENDYVDDNGETHVIDGYNAIAILLQKGIREAMLRVYEDIPEDYWGEEENEGCGCGCGHHHENEEGHCCCGHHAEEEEECCCGHHAEGQCCCGGHGDDEGGCCH